MQSRYRYKIQDIFRRNNFNLRKQTVKYNWIHKQSWWCSLTVLTPQVLKGFFRAVLKIFEIQNGNSVNQITCSFKNETFGRMHFYLWFYHGVYCAHIQHSSTSLGIREHFLFMISHYYVPNYIWILSYPPPHILTALRERCPQLRAVNITSTLSTALFPYPLGYILY